MDGRGNLCASACFLGQRKGAGAMTLTDRQYALLQRLSRMPDVTLSALSQEMDLAPQTLRQDVNALMLLFLLCIAVGTAVAAALILFFRKKTHKVH